MREDLFKRTMNEKFRKSLENYEREGFVVYDPSEKFNDVNEVYFKIKGAEVGERSIIVKGTEYSFVPSEKKKIFISGMEYFLLPTGKKRIPFVFVRGERRTEDYSMPSELIKGEDKENIPLSQIRSFSNYL